MKCSNCNNEMEIIEGGFIEYKCNSCNTGLEISFKELEQELVFYKKALELACIKIAKEELRENKEIIKTIMGEYLQQAKEEIDDNK